MLYLIEYLMLNMFSKLGTCELYLWVNQVFIKVNSDNKEKTKPGN